MILDDLSPIEDFPYYVFKISTGETLFGELVDAKEDVLHIRKPLLIRSIHADNMTETLIGTNWIPFTDDVIIKIKSEVVYSHGKLNRDYIRFYGTVLLKTEISELHGEASERIEGGEPPYIVMKDMVTKMRDVSDYMANKFDIDIPDAVYSAEEKFKTMVSTHLH